MISSVGTALTVWTFVNGIMVALTYRFFNSANNSLISRIDELNARKGLDQSIRTQNLALEYFIPFKNSEMRKYASNNNLSYEKYSGHIKEELGSFYKPLLLLRLHLILLIYSISGIVSVFVQHPIYRAYTWSLPAVLVLSLVLFGLAKYFG